MAVSLNVANSVVDYLRSRGQPSDFQSRKGMYEQSGLNSTFGNFIGSASQNTALLQNLQKQGQPGATPYGTTRAGETITPATPSVPGDTSRGVTPEAAIGTEVMLRDRGQSPYTPLGASGTPLSGEVLPASFDPVQEALMRRQKAFETAGSQYAPEFSQLTEDYANRFARGAAELPQAITAAKATTAVASEGERRRRLAETLATEGNLASRGLTSSGIAAGALGDVAYQSGQRTQNIQAKEASDILTAIQGVEKQYGTEFLRSLGVPESTDYLASLPAPVRGVLEREFERERETLQGKVIGEANRLETEARRIESDIAARGEKGAQAEERLMNLRLKVPAGQSFTFQGETWTGLKDDDPDVQVIQKEDARGNVTVIGLDKRTGQELYKETYAGIGTPSKVSGGGSSSGSTGRLTTTSSGAGKGSNLTFTPTEKRTLQRANITEPEAGALFLSSPAAFRTWFVTNMVPGGAPARREDVAETFKWWTDNVLNKKSGSTFVNPFR